MSSLQPPPPYTAYNTASSYGVESMPDKNPPPPPPPMVVTTGPAYVAMGGVARRIFSRHPASVVCQHCQTNVVTEPRAEVGLTTWAIAGLLIIFGLWLGCCLIPFCVDACKDIYHDCPNCHKTIEIYKPL